MRHNKTYAPFCPEISLTIDIDYSHTVKQALKDYPGANGDELTAVTYAAEHSRRSIQNAIKYYTEYHNKEDEKHYSNLWIQRYLSYLEYLNDNRTKT